MLLTRHQYPALYTSMISQLGPLFHKHGVPMLETAYHNIASWYVASFLCSPPLLSPWMPKKGKAHHQVRLSNLVFWVLCSMSSCLSVTTVSNLLKPVRLMSDSIQLCTLVTLVCVYLTFHD